MMALLLSVCFTSSEKIKKPTNIDLFPQIQTPNLNLLWASIINMLVFGLLEKKKKVFEKGNDSCEIYWCGLIIKLLNLSTFQASKISHDKESKPL